MKSADPFVVLNDRRIWDLAPKVRGVVEIVDFEFHGRRLRVGDFDAFATSAVAAIVEADRLARKRYASNESYRNAALSLLSKHVDRVFDPHAFGRTVYRILASGAAMLHPSYRVDPPRQSFPEWASAKLLSAALDDRGRRVVRMRIVSGLRTFSPASVVCDAERFDGLLVKLGFGVGGAPEPTHETDIFNFALEVFLDPVRCMDDLRPSRFRVSPLLRKRNASLLNRRFREFGTEGCPFGRPDAFPCRRCEYGLDRCGAAVRAVSLVRYACESCQRAFWSDPGAERECVDTFRRMLCRECREKGI